MYLYSNFMYSSPNLIIYNENDNQSLARIFPEIVNVHCNYNFTENIFQCYAKNLTLYNNHTCDICGYDYLAEYNISKRNNTNTNINCFELIYQEYRNII